MLFLDKNKDVIEIRGSGDYKNNCFYSLSSAFRFELLLFFSKSRKITIIMVQIIS